jgi:hypothetical protein
MAAAIISSISPVSGAPGTAITVSGSGFDATARIGCPVLVDTTFGSSSSLQGMIPADLAGAPGQSMLLAVFVQNADSSLSNMLQFTVLFPAVNLQAWTSIDLVIGEVPGFLRNGTISDDTINNWIRSIAQSVSSCLLRRGLPLDPALWAQATPGSASPTPVAVLELITRYGAAARLAAVVSAQFSSGGEWGLSKNLQAAYDREFKLLSDGSYDKLFKPSAATVESGQIVGANQLLTFSGDPDQAFSKDQVF